VSRAIVLDVGHGNCTIVESDGIVAVVDSPVGSLLLDALADLNVTHVEAAFVSHADKDHLAGVLSLLTSDRVTVGAIYVNPDAQRTSAVWEDFRRAVSVAQRKGDCVVHTTLSSTSPGSVAMGDVTIDVLCPSASLALSGVGGKSLAGGAISANTMSAVLRVASNGERGLLLAGDMDRVALEDALEHGVDLTASVLVFPHHGGLPGTGSIDEFLERLLGAVSPDAVLFSNGRQRFDNPKPEIVEQVTARNCQVACTQLSRRCYAEDAQLDSAHLEPMKSKGDGVPASCAGSMIVELDGAAKRTPAAQLAHSRFIEAHVPTPMCMVGRSDVAGMRT